MNRRIRLDQLLVDLQLADSRTKAQAMIMAGEVLIAGQPSVKSGAMVVSDADVRLIEKSRYVSRGGDKLASVAGELALDFKGKVVLDVGASTGGFSDYVLQHGAERVMSVDVGTGQLDWRLRTDPRVQSHEQTDIRNFESSEQADIAMVDVSFVSALKVIDAVASYTRPAGCIIVMIKPQFEAEKAVADKFKGVINDESVRTEILDRVRSELSLNYKIEAEADSAVHGPKGNRERFFKLIKR